MCSLPNPRSCQIVLCCENKSILLQKSAVQPHKSSPFPFVPFAGAEIAAGDRGNHFQRFTVIQGKPSTALAEPRSRIPGRVELLQLHLCLHKPWEWGQAAGSRVLAQKCPCAEQELERNSRNWDGTPPVPESRRGLTFSCELQMFGGSWDSCTAGIVQLFGEFCNIAQLGLVFPNFGVHPVLSVGSSWAQIISALRNNLGANLEG